MAKLKKRADGRYAKQVYLGRGEDGKQKYKTYFGATQKEALAKADEAKRQLGKGINLESAADTFVIWADKYEAVKIAQGVGASHLRSIKNHVNHLVSIGKTEIKKINTGDIQSILNALAEWHDGKPPLSKKTLGQIAGTARRIFDLAIQNRVIDFNPAQYVTVPNGAGKQQREALTSEQQTMVVNTEHRAQLSAMLMMYSGLRRGEATALTWADVDLKAGTIRVNKSVEYVSSQTRIKTTKTEAGIRVVNIPQALVGYLTLHREDNCLYVLHTPKGAMYSAQVWRTLWRSYMADLNVKYGYNGQENKFAVRTRDENGKERGSLPMLIKTFTPHQLRHTFCTLLYLAGVDVMTARDQMGHSNIQTTMSIYTHLDKQYKRSSMQKLDEYLMPHTSQIQVNE